MKWVFITLSIVLCSSVVLAGWNDWTPEQKVAVKAWVKVQPTDNSVKLRRAIMNTVAGYTYVTNQVPRDPLDLVKRKEMVRIAGLASIVKTDTVAQINTKLKAYVASAVTMADVKLALYNCAKFWPIYFDLVSVDPSDTPTKDEVIREPIIIESFAEANNLGTVVCDDVEAAERDK